MDEPCSQQAWGFSGLLSRPLRPRCPAPALLSCRPSLTAHALLFAPWFVPIVQPVGTQAPQDCVCSRRFLMPGELDCVRTACVRPHPDVLSLCRTLAPALARRACAPASPPTPCLQPLHSDVPLDNNAPSRRPQPTVRGRRAMGVSSTSSMSPQQRLALIKLSLINP